MQIVNRDGDNNFGTVPRIWQFRADGGASSPLRFAPFNEAGAVGGVVGTIKLNDGVWHHVVGTYDGTNTTIYVDGKQDGTNTTLSGNLKSGTSAIIIGGVTQNTGSDWFAGSIDDVRIYNGGSNRNVIVIMEIRFTDHAEEKFLILQRHGVNVHRERVLDAIEKPEQLDIVSRSPLYIAQIDFDAEHVLRVVYRIEHAMIVVITFYPGRKSQYES